MGDTQTLDFRRYENEQLAELAAFVAADTYPFNGTPHPTPDDVYTWMADGLFSETFWILQQEIPVGILQYEDLGRTAELHIRLHTIHRGKGIGTSSLRWFTQYLFEQHPDKERLEAWVRYDNIAMRKVLRHCHYVLEARQRQAFPTTGDGHFVDNVGYAILRTDWQQGITTPVQWDEEREQEA